MNERFTKKNLLQLGKTFDEMLSEMSDEELLETVRESGEDPEFDAAAHREMAASITRNLGLDKKGRARIRYEKVLSRYNDFVAETLPEDEESARALLINSLGIQTGATAQFRQFSSLPVSDVMNMLGKLQFLSTEIKELKSPINSGQKEPFPSTGTQNPELEIIAEENFSKYKSPEELLNELEINKPEEIDIEAIAFSQGALVIYEPLQKSEAYTLSIDPNKAVIVVNRNAPRSRQRFSVAHELGHWMRDRNSSVFCEKKAYADSWYGNNSEVMANYYAKDLLMPEFLFAPLVKSLTLTLENVRKLAQTFRTSLTAASRRFVELSSEPSVVVFRKFSNRFSGEPAQTIWFSRGPEVSAELHPHWKKDDGTLAQEIRINDEIHELSSDVNADAWFITPKEKDIKIREESIRINCNNILTILSWQQDTESD